MGMRDKIFDVIVPTQEEIEVKEGKRKTVEKRVFPRLYPRRNEDGRGLVVRRP